MHTSIQPTVARAIDAHIAARTPHVLVTGSLYAVAEAWQHLSVHTTSREVLP